MTNETPDTIKPCPFCGGKADHKIDHTTEESHIVQCCNCCFWISRIHHGDDYIKVWNISPTDAPDFSIVTKELERARRCAENVINASVMGSTAFEQGVSTRNYIDKALEQLKRMDR